MIVLFCFPIDFRNKEHTFLALLNLILPVKIVGSLDQKVQGEEPGCNHGNDADIDQVVEPIVEEVVADSNQAVGNCPVCKKVYQA